MKKENNLKSNKKQNKKNQRREESNGRNAIWRALTPARQLAELDKRGLRAAKQRKKLADLI